MKLSNKFNYPLIYIPYKIIRIKGILYKLDLLGSWRRNRIYYIDRLRKDPTNLLLG